MNNIPTNRVMNGTWGEIWLDGDKVSECTAFQAKIALNKTAISQCGSMAEDTKIIGYKGTGSVKMNKVYSRMATKIGDAIKQGRDLRFVIISKLADPDALGAERVAVKNVSFDDLTLADWVASTPGTVDAPFTFTDYDFLDQVEPE